MVHAEHRKVRGLDLADVALVRDRERAALHVAQARRVHRPTREAPIVGRAGVVALADVRAALRRCPVRGHALVTAELRDGGLAGGEGEDVARVGRVVEVAVEPPLRERVVLEGGNGTVVVGEGRVGYVEAIHGRVPERYAE